MTTRRSRRFQLGDVIVLVAATAIGLALARGAGQSSPFHPPGGHWEWSAFPLSAWTLAWVVIRLRQPRPRLRSLARRPGSAAGFAAATALAMGVVFWLIFTNMRGVFPGSNPWHNFHFYGRLYWKWAGPAVIGGWAVLLLGSRRSRRADWVDWLGLALGLYWAGWNVLHSVGPIIHEVFPWLY